MRMFSNIWQKNYNGWIGCEYAPLGDTVKGLSWIHNIGGKSA